MRRVRVLLLAVGIVFLVPPAASARRVHLTCIDGCPRGRDSACDVDGTRDGVCTFALCASRAPCLAPVPCPCARPLSAAVPIGKSVLKTPDVTFVLRCRRADEIACSVMTTTTSTTTSTTLPPSPSQLTAFLPDTPTTPFFTLLVTGCQAAFPLLNATVVAGTFTCEPSVNCPYEYGFASFTTSEGGVSAEADFVNAGTNCTFLLVPTASIEPDNHFTCRDGSGNITLRGSFGFEPGQHPPCPPTL